MNNGKYESEFNYWKNVSEQNGSLLRTIALNYLI